MQITAPLTVKRLEHAKVGVEAQISKQDLRAYIGAEMQPNYGPMFKLASIHVGPEFVRLMQEPVRAPKTRYRIEFPHNTIWATHNPEGYPEHRWTFDSTEPTDVAADTTVSLITHDLETVLSKLDQLSGNTESRLGGVVKRVAQLYVVDRYELLAEGGMVNLTLVAKDDGGVFSFRFDQ